MKEEKERWVELCEQAAVEQDPQRLVELVREIIQVFEEKRERRQRQSEGDAV
jgi:hypothetical protein